MKKHIAKILRQIAEEKGTDNAHVKRLYKKMKKSWKENRNKVK